MAETATPPAATAPVQGTTTDTTKETTTPVETKTETKDQFAERYELLARKERAIYREKQRLAHERKQSEDMAVKVKAWEDSRSSAKKNPLDYLTQAGLSYDEITQFMLNGGKPTEADKVEDLRSQLEEFKKQTTEERENAKKEAMANQQRVQDEAINDVKEEIKEYLNKNSETYELLSTRGAEEEVFNHLRDSFRLEYAKWKKEGKPGKPPTPMTTEQAVKEMEEFYEQEIERLASTKKMQTKYQPVKQAQDTGQKKGPTPTLSNSMNSSSAASILPAKNESDRMARALAKLG